MKKNRIQCGRELGFLDDFPVDLLAQLEPGLMLDVGAAIGFKTRAMLNANPSSRVVAFEPFPGNLESLESLAAQDSRVVMRPVAIAERTGTVKLFVAAVIKRPGLALPLGSSNVGRLRPRPWNRSEQVHAVPVARLDDEIREPVRFLKIDIQSSEFRALTGAARLFEDHGVDYLYVEFSGDWRVLRLLERRGYVIFDGAYFAWPERFAPRNWFRRGDARHLPDGEIVRDFRLASGARGRILWPRVPFRSFALYCAWFIAMRLFVSGLQTDLFCVHRSKLAAFAQAAAKARMAQGARLERRRGSAQV